MIRYYIILIVMTIIGSVASLFLKKASGSEKLSIFKNVNIYIGGFLYLTSAILNIYVLKYLDYSIVLPMTSITYIWTLILSSKLLNQKISLKKIVGVFCIVVGAIVIAM